MTAGKAKLPSERLVAQALALILEAETADADDAATARAALFCLRSKTPAHDAAVQEAQARWNVLGDLAHDLRQHFDANGPAPGNATDTTASGKRRQARRTALLSGLGVIGGGLLAGHIVKAIWQAPVFQAAYQTGTAQMREVLLPDGPMGRSGSMLELAARTSVSFTLHRHRRVLEMAHGVVRVSAFRDTRRPLEVRLRHAVVEVVGTTFTVRDHGGPIVIGVEHGHVRVRLTREPTRGDQRDDPLDLHDGDMVEISNDGRVKTMAKADAQAMSAWRHGWLVFHHMPLSDALPLVNAYRSLPIVATDASINAMKISGRFRTNDTDGFIAALRSILPVKTERRHDASIWLRHR